MLCYKVNRHNNLQIQVNEYPIKKYKSKLNLFAHVHKHKQAKYRNYRPINTCKSM